MQVNRVKTCGVMLHNKQCFYLPDSYSLHFFNLLWGMEWLKDEETSTKYLQSFQTFYENFII